MFAIALASLPNDFSGLFSHISAAMRYKSLQSNLILSSLVDDPKRPQATQIVESWTADIIDECSFA